MNLQQHQLYDFFFLAYPAVAKGLRDYNNLGIIFDFESFITEIDLIAKELEHLREIQSRYDELMEKQSREYAKKKQAKGST